MVHVDKPHNESRYMEVTEERLRALPKAELHVHLDGSLRPTTLLDLARERGIALPSACPDELAAKMRARDGTSLEAYLDKFNTTLSVLQDAASLERVAYELAIDHVREGVQYLEVRYCPALHTNRGLSRVDAVEAPLRGLRRAEQETGIQTGLIVSGIRNMDPAISRELAQLAVTYKGRGVVAFDLAGAEESHPAKKHREAFYTAINGNLPRTIHAGEAYGPESIRHALHYCQANRIGHGTRLQEDEDLERYVRDFRIPLEICLTSNVQTGAVGCLSKHPARRYFNQGIMVALCTDNRLVSGTTVVEEYLAAYRHLGFAWDELVQMARWSFEAGFLPWDRKQKLLSRFDESVALLSEEEGAGAPEPSTRMLAIS